MGFDADVQGMLDEIADVFGREITIERTQKTGRNAYTGVISTSVSSFNCSANRLSDGMNGVAGGGVFDGKRASSRVEYSGVRVTECQFKPASGDTVIDTDPIGEGGSPVSVRRRIVSVESECNGLSLRIACEGGAT